MSVNAHSIGDIALDMSDRSRIVMKTTGLDDSAEIRTGFETKAQQDGMFDSPQVLGGRVIQVEGFVEEPTSSAAHELADGLRALGLVTSEFIVESAGRGIRSTMVRLSAFSVEWISDRAFTYALTATAPDPLLYGPQTFAQTTLSDTAGGTPLTFPLTFPLDFGVPPGVDPGAINLLNGGKVSYHPRVRVDGRVVNPKITCAETGSWIRYGGTVAAGQWLDIDTARRRVMLNGLVPHRHLVTYSGDWLAIPVDGGSLTWSADSYDSSHALSAWGYEGAWA